MHNPPLQLDQGLSRSGPHTAQLSTLPSWPTVSMCLPLRPYSPPCDYKQPGVSQCCSNFVWQGRELLTRLSPRSPVAGQGGTGLGLQMPWSPGPYCPEAIPLPSVFLVSSIFFGLPSSYLLGYCWLFALFLSRSARCFTCLQGEVDSTPTYLATIFLFPHYFFN